MGVTPVRMHYLSVLEECVTALADLLWKMKHLDPNHLEPYTFEFNVHGFSWCFVCTLPKHRLFAFMHTAVW